MPNPKIRRAVSSPHIIRNGSPMLIRINAALRARRDGLAEDEGFTLIELLVVVIIIGILAAIAVPIYINVQNGAKDSAAKADLANAKTAVVAYYTQNNAFPPSIDSDTLKNFGWSGTSVANKTSGTAAVTNFCLSATGANQFWITQDGVATSAKPATCS
jgi:type IV pilus assembly protein PilA